MKKTITISFLLLLFFSQAGYHIYYSIQQYLLKESIKEQLLATVPESSLEIIDAGLNKKAILWEENGKEFSLNGDLFDVATVKIVNGRTLIYCLNDRKEEQLLKDLAKAVNSSNDQNTNGRNGHHIIKFQLPDYIICAGNEVAANQTVRQKHFGYTAALVTAINEVNTPPPDFIF